MKKQISELAYKIVTAVRNERIVETLREIKKNEFLSKSLLEEIRIIKAKNLIVYAKQNVQFYKDTITEQPSNIKKMSKEEFKDFWKTLKIVTKDDVIKNKKYFISEKIEEFKCYPDKTSGSTGTPLYLQLNSSCWGLRHAREMQVKEWHKIENGEKYALFWGQHWSKRAKIENVVRDFLLNRIRISAFCQSKNYLEESYKRIIKFKPSYLMGYPSAIFDFCSFLKSLNKDLKELNLKAVITTAEPLRDYQREVISEVCDCNVASQYGGAEQGFVACECEKGGFHVFSDTVWFEDENGDTIGGKFSEAIATDLQLYSMPLIRYRTGDEVVFSDKMCQCGRGYPLIEKVEGRCGEDIILPNGVKVNTNLPSYIFKNIAKDGLIRRYRFVDKNDGFLYLYVVPTDRYDLKTEAFLFKEIKKAFGEDIKVIIEKVEALENLPNAKHRDYIKIKNEL